MTHPVKQKDVPLVGEMVLFPHEGDQEVYPALVARIRTRNSGSSEAGPPTLGEPEYQIYIFRPGACEWRWTSRAQFERR